MACEPEPVELGGIGEPDPELLALAREAAGRAYAPYSEFPVGAALRTSDGRRYAGANVENAAYPQGQCAEASAIAVRVVASSSSNGRRPVAGAPSTEPSRSSRTKAARSVAASRSSSMSAPAYASPTSQR